MEPLHVENPETRSQPGRIAKQVFAALVTASIYVVSGYSFSYSSIIVPQLLEDSNSSTIETTPAKTLWIVSSSALGVALSGLLSGVMIDRFGRINTLRLSLVPNSLGWLLIATAQSADTIIAGRFISGFSLSFLLNATFVYIAEISRPSIRPVLLAMPSMCVSVGVLSMFIQGRFLRWRWIAWLVIAYSALISAFLFLVPESPAWLVSKSRVAQARKSLTWFIGADSRAIESEINELIKENAAKTEIQRKVTLKTFKQPTVYRPFFVLIGLLALQQLSGVYVIISNSIIFFMEIGVKYDLYSVTIIIGVIRLVMSVANLWISKTFTRRTLLFVSGLGMTVSLSLSGLFSSWARQDQMWLPVLMVMIYLFFAACGLFALPAAMTSELFPINVRGLMQSLMNCFSNLMSFIALHSYKELLDAFGVVGLQYFYAIMCLAFVLHSFVFVPETYKKKLKDIQTYFCHHSCYLNV